MRYRVAVFLGGKHAIEDSDTIEKGLSECGITLGIVDVGPRDFTYQPSTLLIYHNGYTCGYIFDKVKEYAT